jgi:hypothetical protein
MQPNTATKLGANVASKLASVFQHNDMTTTEDGGKTLDSLVSRIRTTFSYTSWPFYPLADMRIYYIYIKKYPTNISKRLYRKNLALDGK